jgi:hypothetical protein
MRTGAIVHVRTGNPSAGASHLFLYPQAYRHLRKQVHASKLVYVVRCCLGASLSSQALQFPQRHPGCHQWYLLLVILLQSDQRPSQPGLQRPVSLHYRPLFHTADMWRSEWCPCVTTHSIVC